MTACTGGDQNQTINACFKCFLCVAFRDNVVHDDAAVAVNRI